MIFQAISIGIVTSFIFFEITGLSPGGMVVPGYIALFFNQPIRIIVTFLVALIAYFLVNLLSKYIIIYGRRRFLAMVLFGFLIKWLLERYFILLPLSSIEIRSIGYIIPGLIANEFKRQGFLPTLLSLGIVSGMVYLILLFLNFSSS